MFQPANIVTPRYIPTYCCIVDVKYKPYYRKDTSHSYSQFPPFSNVERKRQMAQPHQNKHQSIHNFHNTHLSMYILRLGKNGTTKYITWFGTEQQNKQNTQNCLQHQNRE